MWYHAGAHSACRARHMPSRIDSVALFDKLARAMQKYEFLLVTKSENGLSVAKEILASFGGKITKEDNWGQRKLAYKIKKCDSGYYCVMNIDIQGAKLSEFLKKLQLEDDVLRALIFLD